MKKFLLLMCLAAGLLSCAREMDDIRPEMQDESDVPVTFNISVEETRASKTEWADKDEIYVFFKGLSVKYIKMTYSKVNSQWIITTPNGAIRSSEFSALKDKTLTAVHSPGATAVSYGSSGFTFKNPSYSYYLSDSGRAYTVSGTTVTATLSMQKPEGIVQIHVPGIQSLVNNYTFGCTLIKPVACTGVGTDGTIIETELQAGARLSGIADSDGVIFAGRLTNPNEAKDYTFSLSSDIGNLTSVYTLERKNKSLVPGRMYNTPAVMTGWNRVKLSDLCVDLGLSVKWMTYDVGASKSGERGWKLSWGELQPKGWYGINNYLHWDGNYWTNLSVTKYKGAPTILLEEDDAAYAAWGGQFRMPTEAEWKELRSKCTLIMTQVNGVQGVSAKSLYNNNSIFLPYVPGDNDAYYWTSELFLPATRYGYTNAKDWHLKRAYNYSGYSSRYEGYFVRGVYTGIM